MLIHGGVSLIDLFVGNLASELFLRELNKPAHGTQKLVMTQDGSPLSSAAQSLGVSVATIPAKGFTPEGRDREFRELAMPGLLDGIELPDKDFSDNMPVWKTISIDRLRFWYDPNHSLYRRFIEAIEFSSLIIPFSLHETLPWAAADVAKGRGAKVTAVKVASVLDLSTVAFLTSGHCPIDSLLVSNKSEENFLRKKLAQVKVKTEVKSAGLVPPAREKASDDVAPNTLGILYIPEDDWKFVMLLQSLQTEDMVYVCTTSNDAWMKLVGMLPVLLEDPKIVVTNAAALGACSRVLLPRYIESIVREIPENVAVSYYDIGGEANAIEFSEVLV